MNKALKKQILAIVPNEELKRFLNTEEFDFAQSIIDEIKNDLCVYNGPSDLFNDLYYAIESEDIELFHKIFLACFYLSNLTAISTVLETHSIMSNPEKRSILPEIEKAYFLALNIINRFEELKNLDEIASFKALLALKRKRYNKIRGLKSVFLMPLADDLTSSYTALANYIESLIHSNELTSDDVIHALLNNNYDALMEKIKILSCLKEKYMELKEEEIVEIEGNAQAQMAAIEEIGFPRS